MIVLKHTPAYDPQQASRFRSDRCVRWVRLRLEAGLMTPTVAQRVGLRIRQLHDLEEGALQTDDAGWDALEATLKTTRVAPRST